MVGMEWVQTQTRDSGESLILDFFILSRVRTYDSPAVRLVVLHMQTDQHQGRAVEKRRQAFSGGASGAVNEPAQGP